MQKVIIFCLLLVLITSKTEFGEVQCRDAKTKEECPATKITSKDEVCCYEESKHNGEISGECTDFYKNQIELFKTKEYESITREEEGYRNCVEGNNLEANTIYCQNDEIKIEYKYNDKEISNLKSEDHCLKIKAKKRADASFDVGKCEQKLILESSKKNGIECGTLEANIVLSSTKEIFKWKTCDLFNLKLYKGWLSYQPKLFYEMMYKIIEQNDLKGKVESCTIELYNSKGDKITYDSKTDETNIEGSSCMLFASKYLLLLILILF